MSDHPITLTQECEAIAAHLSALSEQTWTLEIIEPSDWHCLNGPEGAAINLHRFGNHSERLRVHGVYPQGPNWEDCLPYGSKEPEITVARERGAEAISQEILRRFWLDYTKLLRQAQERQALLEADDTAQNSLASRLLVHSCVEAPTGGSELFRVMRKSGTSPDAPIIVSGQIQPTGPGTLTVELRRVPESLANLILTAIDDLTVE